MSYATPHRSYEQEIRELPSSVTVSRGRSAKSERKSKRTSDDVNDTEKTPKRLCSSPRRRRQEIDLTPTRKPRASAGQPSALGSFAQVTAAIRARFPGRFDSPSLDAGVALAPSGAGPRTPAPTFRTRAAGHPDITSIILTLPRAYDLPPQLNDEELLSLIEIHREQMMYERNVGPEVRIRKEYGAYSNDFPIFGDSDEPDENGRIDVFMDEGEISSFQIDGHRYRDELQWQYLQECLKVDRDRKAQRRWERRLGLKIVEFKNGVREWPGELIR